MSRIETYHHWLRLEIAHEYYTPGTIPLRLSPSEETNTFFAKSGILFRSASPMQWYILLPSGETAEKQLALWADENPVMKFDLIPLSGEFFYISGLEEKEEENYSIRKSMQPGVWRQLQIPFTLLNNQPEIKLTIQYVKKLVEFILIPKYNHPDIQLQLSEEKGRVQFSEIEKIMLFDTTQAYRFRSTGTVDLSQNTSYKIKLWEVRKTGNRLLSDAVPLPRCNETSAINPENTISSYFYY